MTFSIEVMTFNMGVMTFNIGVMTFNIGVGVNCSNTAVLLVPHNFLNMEAVSILSL